MSATSKLVGFVQRATAKGAVKHGRKHPAPALPQIAYDKHTQPGAHYTVGFAKTDIMPDDLRETAYWVAGYRNNNRATDVLDPMTCSAMWIDDGTDRGGVAVVSVDSVGLSSYDSDAIVAQMQAELDDMGCRGVFIGSTHNHAGIDTLGYWGKRVLGPLPKSGRDPKFMAIVHAGVQQVIRQAHANRKAGKLYHGSIEAPDVLRDTRPPQVWSKTFTRLRFVPDDGSTETWLLNLASHSEALLGKNSLVSADFPCYMRRRIAELAGAESMFLVGCIGGLIRPKELHEDNIQSTITCGYLLADAACAINNDRELPAFLDFLRQPYYCETENIMLMAAVKLGLIKTNKRFHIGNSKLGYSILTEMTYLNLGGLEMLFLPCELFPELAYGGYLNADESSTGLGGEINPMPLCDIAENPDLLIFNLINDMTGYVVPPNDWHLHEETPYVDGGRDRSGRKHYEETNSLGPNTAATIAAVFTDMMKIVRRTSP
ncbi:MAG: hypothetical protein FWE40_01440 [Oscillospiraceae bacterium]|nr:hypothetical protein [Oscillospiraceae bacterium]